MRPENKILDALKDKSLTNKEIALITKLKVKKVRQLTLKLRTLGEIEVEGKKGREYLYTIKQPKDKYFDGLLFTFIADYGKVDYEQLVHFYATLGIEEYNVLFRLIHNLQRRVINIINVPEGLYSEIIYFFIHNLKKKLKHVYPLTMTFQEAYTFFQPLGFRDIEHMVESLQKLSKTYPEFVKINTYEKGKSINTFTFEQIFIKDVAFVASGTWKPPNIDDFK
ncbi:MAG: hypothetical protein ACFE96_14120 [Candidatus Hermodarchaeota archaeon]